MGLNWIGVMDLKKKMVIGKNIALHREKRGWKKVDLARLSGVNVRTISRLENPREEDPTPSKTTLSLIAHAFKIEEFRLESEDDTVPATPPREPIREPEPKPAYTKKEIDQFIKDLLVEAPQTELERRVLKRFRALGELQKLWVEYLISLDRDALERIHELRGSAVTDAEDDIVLQVWRDLFQIHK